jgi:hypothetical protein
VSARSPHFWVVSGFIFFANALFSLSHGYWFLGLLQLVTAALAGVDALYSSRRIDLEREL